MIKSIGLLLAFLLAHGITAFAPPSAFLKPSPLKETASPKGLFQAADATAIDEKAITEKTPIILLSGFLGTGKTTALKHLLENSEGAKIGVIVNDVASVNIDAKLVSSMPESAGGDMIELQNGCACCSLSDELFTSIETLFKPKDKKKKRRNYDAIVVELSGVADPMAVAATWQMAEGQADQFPATKLAHISKIVTMIDAGTFGTDYMTWDAAAERPNWVESGDDCAGNRKVAELLVEQIEAANLLLVNKVDMASKEEVEVATKVARALNKNAAIHEVSYGKISPEEMLNLGTSGVKTGPMEGTEEQEVEKVDDTTSSHSHDHHEHDCSDPGCTDESHSHSHHEHSHDHDCSDPNCSDNSHSHSHDHDCSDPNCSDTSHSHSHSHGTSTDNLGIANFVYKKARPFSMHRLMVLLNTWPVPVKDTLDLETLTETAAHASQKESPFEGIVRSKGFAWIAPSRWSGPAEDAYRHDTAMYWSHAGKSFTLGANGKWWSSISLFDGWQDYMKRLFKDNMKEYERIIREDFVSEEFGDRRQELVFIGVGIDEEKITKELDDCLLTDAEMEKYRQNLKNYQDTVLSLNSNKGLFDVEGNVEHTEV